MLRSVGYRAVPLPGVPFDERRFVLPNERGPGPRTRTASRSPASTPSAGSSAGPTGILGTNKRDAEETIGCLAEDLRAGALPEPPNAARAIDALLAERKPDAVTVDGWRAIDAHELERGRGGAPAREAGLARRAAGRRSVVRLSRGRGEHQAHRRSGTRLGDREAAALGLRQRAGQREANAVPGSVAGYGSA